MDSELNTQDTEHAHHPMTEKEFQNDIEQRVKKILFPLLNKYELESTELKAILKWKPIALILGNYSSGKSTLINELIGREVQRTGQAPTDDSFTILTAPGKGDTLGEIHGATLVNNEQLPFGALKSHGEMLLAHFRMKYVESPILENLTIIDSPGMMDSVTEKGRGYDFLSVVGDLIRLADLVVLMFDPHKAGTIKETYSTIRNMLPVSSGEDRVVFVLSRIDDCDSVADLVRSYGTLCWNLSQMTGRKDIPRIYLTYSPTGNRNADALTGSDALDVWTDERKALTKRILGAQELRISHILHHVDKRASELKMITEAMAKFCRGGRRLFNRTLVATLLLSIAFVLFLDTIVQRFTGFPDKTVLTLLRQWGELQLANSEIWRYLLIPAVGCVASILIMSLLFSKLLLPGYARKYKKNVDRLATYSTPYWEHTWSRAKNTVIRLLGKVTVKGLFVSHQKHLETLDRFMSEELQSYFGKIR